MLTAWITGKYDTLLALLIELRLPNETAANVYLAGVRSRCASVEISEIEHIKRKTIVEIKSILVDFPEKETAISDSSKVWINNISVMHETQKPQIISFPNFRLKQKEMPDILYVRENDRRFYLVSANGRFQLEIESTEKLPFKDIANLRGLYFEFIGSVWQMKTYNPRLSIE